MVLLSLIPFLAIYAGIIILQVFLSKRESKWPGLILPMLSFGTSLLIIFSIIAFMGVRTETHFIESDAILVVDVDEIYITEEMEARIAEIEAMREEFAAQHSIIEQEQIGTIITRILFTFIYANIPTGIFIAIYFACRGKQRRKRALDMMSLQDM